MKFKQLTIACMGMALAAAYAPAQAGKYTSDKEQLSYTLGFQVGQNIQRQNMDLDLEVLTQAIRDVLGGGTPAMTQDEMKAAVENYRNKLAEEKKQAGEAAKKVGDEFLAANKKKEGVTTTASGLQYKVVKAGTGAQPKATDTIEAHYEGRLISGKVFDSSYKRGTPATFPVNGVIKGWQEVLPLMKTGGKWQVYIPSELAYGASGTPSGIGPNETLIFDIELIAIKDAPKK